MGEYPFFSMIKLSYTNKSLFYHGTFKRSLAYMEAVTCIYRPEPTQIVDMKQHCLCQDLTIGLQKISKAVDLNGTCPSNVDCTKTCAARPHDN